jgi:hypothetical protein
MKKLIVKNVEALTTRQAEAIEYKIRRKQYTTAQEQALSEFNALPVKVAADAAGIALDKAREARSIEEAALNEEIWKLQAKIAGLPAVHKIEALNAERIATSNACRHARTDMENTLTAQFIDIAHAWTPAQWRRNLAQQANSAD